MPDIWKKATSGEPINGIPADAYNLFLDTAKYVQGLRSKDKAGQVKVPAKVELFINNTTGNALRQFAIVGLGAESIVPGSDDANHFGALAFEAAASAQGSPFAILQEPAADTFIVPALMAGASIARVNYSSIAHEYADASGSYISLASQANAGPVRILWSDLPSSTTLNGGINASVTAIVVAAATGWPDPAALEEFVVQIDSEKLLVTAVSGANWTVTRGYAGTSAASHSNGAGVSFVSGTVWAFVAFNGNGWDEAITISSSPTHTAIGPDFLFQSANDRLAIHAGGLNPPTQNPIIGLAGGTLGAGPYYYVVTAVNINGQTVKSNEQSYTPTGGDNTAVLSWTKVTGASGYKVYRSTTTNVYTNTLIGTLIGGDDTSFLDDGIATGAGSPPATNETGTNVVSFDVRGTPAAEVEEAFELPAEGGTVDVTVPDTGYISEDQAITIYDPATPAIATGYVDSVTSSTEFVFRLVKLLIGNQGGVIGPGALIGLVQNPILGMPVLNAPIANGPLYVGPTGLIDSAPPSSGITTDPFTIPAIGSSVSVNVNTTTWIETGSSVMIADGTRLIYGWIVVNSSTSITIYVTQIIAGAAGNTMSGDAIVLLAPISLSSSVITGFTIPAVGGNVSVTTTSTGWIPANQEIMIYDGSDYIVGFAVPTSATALTIYVTMILGGAAGNTMGAGATIAPFTSPYRLPTTATFTIPAVNSTASVSLPSTAWIVADMLVLIGDGTNLVLGYVSSVTNATTFVFTTLYVYAGSAGNTMGTRAITRPFSATSWVNPLLGRGALATGATVGFPHLPTMSGTPSGVPTLYSGYAPITLDSTNNKLYSYMGGAWRDLSGGGSGTVTSVDVSGGTTGLTTSGGPITTSGTITIAGTLVVANGGTGRASHTAYAVICGGTTSTGAQQSVSGVGTTGQVLTSNGADALPTWQSAGSGTVTSVDIDGGTTGLTSSGGPITTSGDLTLGGVLVVANGGTGASNRADALANLMPNYTNSGLLFARVNATEDDVEYADPLTPMLPFIGILTVTDIGEESGNAISVTYNSKDIYGDGNGDDDTIFEIIVSDSATGTTPSETATLTVGAGSSLDGSGTSQMIVRMSGGSATINVSESASGSRFLWVRTGPGSTILVCAAERYTEVTFA